LALITLDTIAFLGRGDRLSRLYFIISILDRYYSQISPISAQKASSMNKGAKKGVGILKSFGIK
jgi:hypothetical protein